MNRIVVLLALSFSAVVPTAAQFFSDQGLMSGSGLSVLPTARLTPPMECRVQFSRIAAFRGRNSGLNIISLHAGLSSTIDGYVRATAEQPGGSQSQFAYAFGGKFLIPKSLPVIQRLAFWSEKTSTDNTVGFTMFPSDVVRFGISSTLDSAYLHPTILLGYSRVGTLWRPLIGIGGIILKSNSAQIGCEVLHGYIGRRSVLAAITGSMRVFANVGLQIAPGYVQSPTFSSWMLSIGLSASTADIDFNPTIETVPQDEFILPSIDDLEREGKQPPPGDDTPPVREDEQRERNIEQNEI